MHFLYFEVIYFDRSRTLFEKNFGTLHFVNDNFFVFCTAINVELTFTEVEGKACFKLTHSTTKKAKFHSRFLTGNYGRNTKRQN